MATGHSGSGKSWPGQHGPIPHLHQDDGILSPSRSIMNDSWTSSTTCACPDYCWLFKRWSNDLILVTANGIYGSLQTRQPLAKCHLCQRAGWLPYCCDQSHICHPASELNVCKTSSSQVIDGRTWFYNLHTAENPSLQELQECLPFAVKEKECQSSFFGIIFSTSWSGKYLVCSLLFCAFPEGDFAADIGEWAMQLQGCYLIISIHRPEAPSSGSKD